MKIYKFGASWCPVCKTQDNELEKIKGEIQIEKFTMDSEEDDIYFDKYNIKSLPTTIIVDENENELKRFIGLVIAKNLEKELENYN